MKLVSSNCLQVKWLSMVFHILITRTRLICFSLLHWSYVLRKLHLISPLLTLRQFWPQVIAIRRTIRLDWQPILAGVRFDEITNLGTSYIDSHLSSKYGVFWSSEFKVNMYTNFRKFLPLSVRKSHKHTKMQHVKTTLNKHILV